MGCGAPQAPRLYRQGRRSPLTGRVGFLGGPIRKRLSLPKGKPGIAPQWPATREIRGDRWDALSSITPSSDLPSAWGLLIALFGWEDRVDGSRHPRNGLRPRRGAINAVGHKWGKRPHDNLATNNQWLAWLVAGEGLHNNHHAATTSGRLSMARARSIRVGGRFSYSSCCVSPPCDTARGSPPLLGRNTRSRPSVVAGSWPGMRRSASSVFREPRRGALTDQIRCCCRRGRTGRPNGQRYST